jgi:hypothetical protein
MASIALVTAHSRFPWFRQIPGGGDAIGDFRFTLDEIAPDCAFAVVYDEPAAPVPLALPRERRMVVLSEPPGVKTYHPGYLDQFGIVMGPITAPGHSGRMILAQPALSWFYGVAFMPAGLEARETVDSLLAMTPPAKIENISVILSRKSQLPKHRARLAFVEKMQARLGERLRVFGRGFADIADKAEAIRPYAYHLVLENNDIDHFWTEKTADAFLGWSLPIFSGAANLDRYFDPDAFIRIDIGDPMRAGDQLEAILDQAPYRSRIEAIGAARHLVLTRYNLFSILIDLAAGPEIADAPRGPVCETILPNKAFAGFGRIKSAMRRLMA